MIGIDSEVDEEKVGGGEGIAITLTNLFSIILI